MPNSSQSATRIAIIGGLAVALGALGAHALETRLEAGRLAAFETGVRIQFVHALALLGLHALDPGGSVKSLRVTAVLFLAGTACFSGSVYALALQGLGGYDAGFLGPVTPAGGLLLLAGWVTLAAHALARRARK